MPIIETIIKDLQENHRALIPQGAMDHLESVPANSVFTGSVFVTKTLVPTLFLKLSAKTAASVGLLPDEFYNPSYKFLTIEDQDGNVVSLVTLQQDGKRIMHAQLDPGDRQVWEFIRLAKQQECFCLDVTVDHKKKPYGTSEFFEIDGEHLEWITRNLVRAANVKVTNEWSRAADAYQSQQGFSSRDAFLSFHGGGNHQLHAAGSTSFISRGDDDYEPDLDLAMSSVISYKLDWLDDGYGIKLTDAPAMPVSPELSKKLAKFSPASFSSKQLRELEVLLEEYPDEAMVLFPLMVVYGQSGDEKSRQEVLRKLTRLAQKRTYTALTILQIMPDHEFMAAFRKEWPQRELTDHPVRGGHPFTPKDFILFEELSIRHALLKQQIEAAIKHFARLTEFGTSGQVLDSLANKISRTLLFRQLDRTPVLPEKLPSTLLKMKHPDALKLLTDSYWGHVEVLRTKMDINTRANKPTSSTRIGPRSGPRIGRNAPCPCGSGKKYKRCCGR